MFNASLPPGLGTGEYKGCVFTEYPHPNHPSLTSLLRRCHDVNAVNPRRAPTILFIQEGVHEVEGRHYLRITYPMKIIGAGQEKTIIHGGFKIQEGTKEEKKRVDMQGMTMKGSSECGLYDDNGLSFLCKDMTFTQCGDFGVYANNTKGRLINCVITQCGGSGIVSWRNALIELEGDQTKVDGNGTGGYFGCYGLETSSTSSIIHLLFPLTEESVSTNNHNGQNYGGKGEIAIVDNDGNTIEIINEASEEESVNDY
jgi:hypothetical protein